jgi:hypothetical protein
LVALLLTIPILLGNVAALLRRTGLALTRLIAHPLFLTMLAGLFTATLLVASQLLWRTVLALLAIARSRLLLLISISLVSHCKVSSIGAVGLFTRARSTSSMLRLTSCS